MYYMFHIYNNGCCEAVVKRGIREVYFEANYGNYITLYRLCINHISRINA